MEKEKEKTKREERQRERERELGKRSADAYSTAAASIGGADDGGNGAYPSTAADAIEIKLTADGLRLIAHVPATSSHSSAEAFCPMMLMTIGFFFSFFSLE